MSTGTVVTCDTEKCLALFLAIKTGSDGETRTADAVSRQARTYAEEAGWITTFGFDQPVTTCPACADGQGPVLERGKCEHCLGRTVAVDGGERCGYCRHTTPYQDDNA
ncbi:hypothetical protein [Streptomyces sp. NPDC085665]|uniref:hypothetical protein n=1 Tax=Streptomyces sp. NPDC085665 TaxID=3365735 RepID=UPI0037D2F6DF